MSRVVVYPAASKQRLVLDDTLLLGAVRVLDQGPAPASRACALFPDMPAPRLALHHDGAFTFIATASDGAAELIAAAALALADVSAVRRRPA